MEALSPIESGACTPKNARQRVKVKRREREKDFILSDFPSTLTLSTITESVSLLCSEAC